MKKTDKISDAGATNIILNKDLNWQFDYKGKNIICSDYVIGNIMGNSSNINLDMIEYFDRIFDNTI